MSRRLTTQDPGFAEALGRLVDDRRQAGGDVRDTVRTIIDEVRRDGERALRVYGARFDGLAVTTALRVSAGEIESLAASCPQADLDALAFAAERIRAFHRLQRPQDLTTTDAAGVTMSLRWQPIDAVGLYVPGGSAAYPSSLLMNAIPAQIAGCRRLAIAVPTPRGEANPLVFAAARLLGVDEIWRVGGAQAIAALAYGAGALAPVDKIVGPGNAYVAEAKRQVFGDVGIDMIAGPSEVLVIADGTADAAWVAADLLSQAEHDEDAQAILVTNDPGLAERVAVAVEEQVVGLGRRDIAAASWRRNGGIITVADLGEAAAIANRLAPEHLELIVAEPAPLLESVRHAGSIFVGPYTPEVIGDYVGGPNHVLPTSRSARFASGLGVLDFMKRTTVLACDEVAFGRLGPAAERLAGAEGLDAHAQAVRLRFNGVRS